MKIKSTDSIGSSSAVRRTGKTKPASGANFASHLSETEQAEGVVSTNAVGNIDSLLSLQALESTGGGNAKARRHGEDVLGVLQEILHDLLMGGVPAARLRNLADLMQRQRVASGVDPKMMEIIDEIETRALVELAKYEMNI